MALDNDAVLSVGTGHFYALPYNESAVVAPPTDLVNPGASWTAGDIGHTSLEDIFNITSEGGDVTVLGTLQAKSLRTRRSPRTETLAVILQQFDTPALELYYGDNFEEIAADSPWSGVPSEPVPSIRTFLAVFEDGVNAFGFYIPKAEIFRGDDLSISDTESLVGLPLGIKPLQHGTNKWNYAVTPLGAV